MYISMFSPTHPGLSPVLSHAGPVALLVARGHVVGARFKGAGLSACNRPAATVVPWREVRARSRLTGGLGWAAMVTNVGVRRRIAPTSRGRPLLP